MNITEDYVSFEVAKLLKEKGFHEPCIATYNSTTKNFQVEEIYEDWTIHWKGYISVPTHQMAMKWLREVHNITIEPLVDFGSSDKYWWSADISYIKKDGLITTLTAYNTYEEAVEAALKYVLENLI